MMYLYAFKPEGHGEKSFFVMAESLEQANKDVKEYIVKNDLYDEMEIFDSDYYTAYGVGIGVVIDNDND